MFPRKRKSGLLRGLLRSLAFALGLALAFCTSVKAVGAQDDLSEAQTGIEVLQHWYSQDSGLYKTTGWWNSANAITVLANYSRISGSQQYFPVFANTLVTAQKAPDGAPGFLNRYYDDEGWWALAWIDVYDLTGDTRYLNQAASIFADMTGGWDDSTCGGGVWWSKDKKQKNAIENELFLSVAASLANRATDAQQRAGYLDWARREWRWFEHTGMRNDAGLINDGVKATSAGRCVNNGANPWTYNQGVILGALVELNHAAPDRHLPQVAKTIALAALSQLTDSNGVLHELIDANSGGDAPQFKGIFVRNLMALNAAFPDRRFRAFFQINADSIWNEDRSSRNEFGFWWAGPFDQADASRQSSALDALVAAAALHEAHTRERQANSFSPVHRTRGKVSVQEGAEKAL